MTTDCQQLFTKPCEGYEELQREIERMRDGLERIKAGVVGEAHPHWDPGMRTTHMRHVIADICDIALSNTGG